MASRYIGRLESRVLRRKCSFSLSSQPARYSARQYATQQSFEGQTSVSSSSSSSKSSMQQERDPSLPPKPPPGTYPHPFPNSRDDPYSNSMRLSYQYPPSMSQQSWQSPYVPSRQGPYFSGANGPVTPERWTELNAMAGIEPSAAPVTALPQQTPLYVIHVKSTSNNTIITLHATPTPRSQILSPILSRSSAGRSTMFSPAPFSVESNPDAAPQEQYTGASGLSQQDQSNAKATSVPANEPLRTPTPAELPPSSSFTPPTANRCIGWASGGSCHYKKVNRSTYEAGYAASVRIIRRVEEAFEHLAGGGRIEDLAPMKEVKGALSTLSDATRLQGNNRPPFRLRVVYTGFGTGREAFNAAVLSADGAFVRALVGQVQDKTPIKVGGCRGKKMRRV